jgi:hypothetical protein
MGNFVNRCVFNSSVLHKKMVLNDYNAPLELVTENLNEEVNDDEGFIFKFTQKF